jgi:hypothetical protein
MHCIHGWWHLSAEVQLCHVNWLFGILRDDEDDGNVFTWLVGRNPHRVAGTDAATAKSESASQIRTGSTRQRHSIAISRPPLPSSGEAVLWRDHVRGIDSVGNEGGQLYDS